MGSEAKEHWVAELRRHLAAAKALRAEAGADPRMSADRLRLRAWQAERLAATYRDLLDSERYRAAARFFLDQLYGPKDLSERDHEVERILPTLAATLPASGLRTLALAVELDALSEELDTAMAKELRRARAMARIGEIGSALAALVRKPLVHAALRLMRGPAKLAGLADLHQFLEDGYEAFRKMGDPDEFLATVAAREALILRRLFEGAPRPFEITRPRGAGHA